MAMLADVVDAVIGGDTHRDTHALELTAPSGVHIATLSITNDEAGFAEALAWIGEHAPGPRVVVALEGTRSYGIGLARALAAAGLMVVRSNVHAGSSGGGASLIRSMLGLPRCTPCAWTPGSCRRRGLTAIGRHYGFCSVLGGRWSLPGHGP